MVNGLTVRQDATQVVCVCVCVSVSAVSRDATLQTQLAWLFTIITVWQQRCGQERTLLQAIIDACTT